MTSLKKLQLNKETLRSLTEAQAADAVGALPVSYASGCAGVCWTDGNQYRCSNYNCPTAVC